VTEDTKKFKNKKEI